MDKAAEAVKNAIMNGIDLIKEGAGIEATLATFIVQICATIVLFLFVRFFLWNTVTNILDNRKLQVEKALEAKKNALDEVEKLNQEAKTIIDDSKETANQASSKIINDANVVADEIIQNAKVKAASIIDQATEEVKLTKASMQEEIKNEIIEVAYLLSEKITKENIDKNQDTSFINQFIEEHQND